MKFSKVLTLELKEKLYPEKYYSQIRKPNETRYGEHLAHTKYDISQKPRVAHHILMFLR